MGARSRRARRARRRPGAIRISSAQRGSERRRIGVGELARALASRSLAIAGELLDQRQPPERVERERGRRLGGGGALEVAQRLVVGTGVGDQRLAERGAGLEIVAVLGDRLAQLADRLVEVAAPAPRDAEPAIRVGEDAAIAAGLGDRARERRDRELVAGRAPTSASAVADERRRIPGAQLERALERLDARFAAARSSSRASPSTISAWPWSGLRVSSASSTSIAAPGSPSASSSCAWSSCSRYSSRTSSLARSPSRRWTRDHRDMPGAYSVPGPASARARERRGRLAQAEAEVQLRLPAAVDDLVADPVAVVVDEPWRCRRRGAARRGAASAEPVVRPRRRRGVEPAASRSPSARSRGPTHTPSTHLPAIALAIAGQSIALPSVVPDRAAEQLRRSRPRCPATRTRRS